MKTSIKFACLLALGFGVGATVACGDEAPPRPIDNVGGSDEGGGGAGGGDVLPTTEGIISDSSASTYESDPQLDVNGEVVSVVWTARQTPASPGKIGYAISTDGGATFTDAQFIESTDDESFEAADVVVDNGGTSHVVFIGSKRIGGGAAIYVATAQGGATTFADPIKITDDTMQGFYGAPRATLTNTVRLVVAYTETDAANQTAALRVATREQTGTDWTIQNQFGGGGNYFWPTPCAAAGTMMGRTYLTYMSQGRITLLRSDDNGDTWSQTQASADGDSIGGLPSCVAEGQNVWVSYGVRGNIGLNEIKVAYSADGGDTITNVNTVSDPDAKPLFGVHQLAVQSPETGHLVYDNGSGLGDKSGSLRRVRFTPANLEPPPIMMPDDPPPGLPSVVVTEPITMQLIDDDTQWLGRGVGLDFHSGDLYVAYVDNTEDESHIAFKVVTP